ncbi:DNA polymerase ligase N-terminal domain-containing protein [Streptomyces sp. NRRL F-5123]|uniref:DNA polymerase ligase N-terminal domain-containing protein n=1 Tax=Streptomyces sp. NRRL F-5123 TaxID=1463856 RepID=UPI000694D751|nr:DNA polymerase ligase N-terminal domain-containing protein [Streptomyces sp. NRRL F-5123]
MAARDRLAEYRRRRDFARTREPEGRGGHGADGGGEPSFVVQIHDATSLHFDFRLEAGGVLKSWAVPKGPSDDPHDKRLAMPTEDHPLDYRGFEGAITAGEYGAGTVIVWDEGTYENATEDRRGRPVPLAEGVERGHVSFRLAGHKLHGGWSLTRIRGSGEDGGREAWLLVKRADARAGRHATPDPRRARSALSGRTLGQMRAAAEAGEADTWESDRSGHGQGS